MDLNKIFLKDACPTKMGGQAVMEGIMMKGEAKTALAVRLPNGTIRVETTPTKSYGKWMKIPLLRGVVAFVDSLINGTKTLMRSAEMLGDGDDEEYEQTRFERWVEEKFGSKALWNVMLTTSMVVALAFTIGIFIIMPTGVVNLLKHVTDSVLVLNLVEGILRIALFVAYVAIVSYMPDIRRVFQYHGAEHKTIHCFESGLELKPENARQFPTLHPRCGTSFLMFVFIIAFACHFLLGWPSLALRIITRLLLLPVIAGISYELLKWAGRSDNIVVKILSLPGLYLQKITTKEPDDSMLEVAIAGVHACMDELPTGSWQILPGEDQLTPWAEPQEEPEGEKPQETKPEDEMSAEETPEDGKPAETLADGETAWPAAQGEDIPAQIETQVPAEGGAVDTPDGIEA